MIPFFILGISHIMNKQAMFLALSLTALSNVHAAGVDVDAGKDAFETCRGCHTSPGTSNVYPTYYVPKIGGQHPSYTVAALKAYKASNRPHRTMMANTISMSDSTMANVAAYLATVDGSTKAIQNGGDAKKGKVLAAACIACHNGDIETDSSNPILAGQHANYLERAISEYQSGKRTSPLMQSMVQGLSEDDVKDIAAYFTNQKGLTTVE
ncbi:MAG: c-type cytochrome [Methyloprofundus sp.]|nr:c-type cytochrome [Methyloprofundus sp.]